MTRFRPVGASQPGGPMLHGKSPQGKYVQGGRRPVLTGRRHRHGQRRIVASHKSGGRRWTCCNSKAFGLLHGHTTLDLLPQQTLSVRAQAEPNIKPHPDLAAITGPGTPTHQSTRRPNHTPHHSPDLSCSTTPTHRRVRRPDGPSPPPPPHPPPRTLPRSPDTDRAHRPTSVRTRRPDASTPHHSRPSNTTRHPTQRVPSLPAPALRAPTPHPRRMFLYPWPDPYPGATCLDLCVPTPPAVVPPTSRDCVPSPPPVMTSADASFGATYLTTDCYRRTNLSPPCSFDHHLRQSTTPSGPRSFSFLHTLPLNVDDLPTRPTLHDHFDDDAPTSDVRTPP